MPTNADTPSPSQSDALSPDVLSMANIEAAQNCIRETTKLIANGAKEANLRETFAFYLGKIFPQSLWWVEDHVKRGEANSAFTEAGAQKRGFIDNLVGLTVIEYEANLNDNARFKSGYQQVGNYCASLINKGYDQDLVLGVLSDTVRWRAYRVRGVSIPPEGQLLGGDHLDLEEVEQLDLAQPDELNAERLVSFLLRYLGREGSRPLNASTIAHDLGFESKLRADHAEKLMSSVEKTLNETPVYAQLIEDLWRNFVGYLGDETGYVWNQSSYRNTYAAELYILTLAKLLCANVLEKRALQSDDNELTAILNGDHFRAKGLTNLVEYDYFGWLNATPHVEAILPIARQIQSDLRAYDFASQPEEDLFGHLMAQLAHRTQRLLLGQEWTPAWLASKIVRHTMKLLPQGTPPRFIDMCCGSGAMVVETLRQVMDSHAGEADASARLALLTQAITGFDIDPLAVMLSKIGWIIAARSWIEPLDGSRLVTVPIYHADSLFAATPLSRLVESEIVRGQISSQDDEQAPSAAVTLHRLHLAEYEVEMPSFLISPDQRELFEALLNSAYSLGSAGLSTIERSTVEMALEDAGEAVGVKLVETEKEAIATFLFQLSNAISELNKEGRNGIWSFILRNSYRPGLLRGQFNGLVSNPPWLALSRIASNPYREQLRRYAQAYDITPPGPSHLHLELATIFLLHAVEQYLEPEAICGCVLPGTVLNGYHHQPWRAGAFRKSAQPVPFYVEEVWRVETGVFKNEAVVVFGSKSGETSLAEGELKGALTGPETQEDLTFRVVKLGKRNAWTDNVAIGKEGDGFFSPAAFRQGADIMPRTLFFHEVGARSGNRVHLSPIDRASSSLRFLIKDAKTQKNFQLTPRYVPERFLFDVFTSNLLTPFHLESPSKAFLPIRKNAAQEWEAVPAASVAASPEAQAAWNEVLAALGKGTTFQDLYERIDTNRRKLSNQQLPTTGYLVVQGAGGGIVCSAYTDLTKLNAERIIIDQTLYAATVESEDEAIYLTGLLNSSAVNEIIKDFQPSGNFKERHVHKLALGVTPPFDNSQEAHLEVVRTTKSLMEAYENLVASDTVLQEQFDPNKALAQRRTRLRRALQTLPEYGAYDAACRVLYGVE